MTQFYTHRHSTSCEATIGESIFSKVDRPIIAKAIRAMTLLILTTLTLSACGIQRPLIAPKDIPAYEERLKRKRERLEDPAPVAAPEAAKTSGGD